MTTEKISEYSKRSEIRYCNNCNHFSISVAYSLLYDENSKIGYRDIDGWCWGPGQHHSIVNFYTKACDGFTLTFHPKLGVITEQEYADICNNTEFRLMRKLEYEEPTVTIKDSKKYIKISKEVYFK